MVNPIERALRLVDRYQQRHGWLGFPFAVVKKFGDDKGGNLTTLLAWNGFFALFPLLLILVTTLGFLLGRHPALEQQVLHSTLAEFPIIVELPARPCDNSPRGCENVRRNGGEGNRHERGEARGRRARAAFAGRRSATRAGGGGAVVRSLRASTWSASSPSGT